MRGARRNGPACSRPPAQTIKSYRDIVRAYIRCYRNDASAELDFFSKQPSLAKAIHYAARSIMPNGKRHPHQRRRPASVLRAAERRLRAAARFLRNCRSFAELHHVIRAEIGVIHGVGPLTIYDIATRIGGHVGLEPDMVYLHAGTSEGAKALGLDGAETLAPTGLPPAFRALRPREMEDCLCIYASKLSRLRSNFAVQRTGARVARSGR
jgi:hypothetical protein